MFNKIKFMKVIKVYKIALFGLSTVFYARDEAEAKRLVEMIKMSGCAALTKEEEVPEGTHIKFAFEKSWYELEPSMN